MLCLGVIEIMLDWMYLIWLLWSYLAALACTYMLAEKHAEAYVIVRPSQSEHR